MKKICFFSGDISRSGGTERVGSIIANALSDKGYRVYMLSCWFENSPHYWLSERIQVHYLLNPKKEGKLYRTYIYPILKLHKFIKKYHIDVIIDIDTELSIYSAYAIIGTSCHLVSWEHFNYWAMLKLDEKKRFRAKRLIKNRATRLVVLTEEDRQKHIQVYGFKENTIYTIHNPCMMTVKPDYNYNKHLFLAIGRLVEQKGFDLLLKAWKIVEQTIPNWRLVIVGDGEDKDNLIQLKTSLRLKNIKFVGSTSHIEEYYSKASCFVLSSRYEGFPMVILEAQSFALPVISFNCKTGPGDMLKDGINGYLVSDGNVEALANAMITFTQSEQMADSMSDKAKEMVSIYNLERISAEWVKLLETL